MKESSVKEVNGTTICTEIFDFAGEEVRVDKVMTKAEIEKKDEKIAKHKRR